MICASAASRSVGDEAIWEIATAEGSWVLNDQSFLSFKYTDFTNLGSERPDTLFGFPITVGPGGTVLDPFTGSGTTGCGAVMALEPMRPSPAAPTVPRKVRRSRSIIPAPFSASAVRLAS